jgi:hypothetical protein
MVIITVKSVLILSTIANAGGGVVFWDVRTNGIGGGCDDAPCCKELGEDRF